MGNHEWCPNCEEDDFHRGEPCDPKKVAKRVAREKQEKLRKTISITKMEKALDKAGIPYELNEYGHAEVKWWQF